MARHYVLTRALYGPEWTPEANARRLAITAGVTVEMMRRQTLRAWTWIVLLDPRDPLRAERQATFESAGVEVVPLVWRPRNIAAAPWDTRPARFDRLEQVAATAYRAPWTKAIGSRDEQVLMTRLDDDDALAADALARMARAARDLTDRAALILPVGYRVWAGRYQRVRHTSNAMHTLSTPAGDTLCVYDYPHGRLRQTVPAIIVDHRPGWLWARHRDTLSDWRMAHHRVTRAVRREFPIDWRLL